MKRIFLIILFALSGIILWAQPTIMQHLLTMPDSICPYFDMNARIKMVEYYNQSIPDSLENSYGGKSFVSIKTDSYIRLEVAEGFSLEILKDSISFILIQTACAPVCSSIVRQYEGNWMYMREIKPEQDGIFMLAKVIDGNIVWEDQTPLLLDDEEKRHYLQ